MTFSTRLLLSHYEMPVLIIIKNRLEILLHLQDSAEWRALEVEEGIAVCSKELFNASIYLAVPGGPQ